MNNPNIVYLSTGSNLGRREQNLIAALDALSKKVSFQKISSLYETEPWGYVDQPKFLNQVVECLTELPPRGLKDFVKETETALGRTPSFQNGPRLIDIDILFYNDVVLNEPDLVIPHPRLQERAFVLVPLAQIAPGLIHPLLHLDAKSLLEKVDAAGVKLYPSSGTVPDDR